MADKLAYGNRDVETVVVPPEAVGRALESGSIAGFCAGAPWGDMAERDRFGRVLLGTSAIWPFHPEKCLCVGKAWAQAQPQSLRRLLRALLRAQLRCDRAAEAPAVARLLSAPEGLALREDGARAALPGGGGVEMIRFHSGEAWFPAQAHALWFIGQMRRWGWMPDDLDDAALARQVYRPDLLAPAVEVEGLYPGADCPTWKDQRYCRHSDVNSCAFVYFLCRI